MHASVVNLSGGPFDAAPLSPPLVGRQPGCVCSARVRGTCLTRRTSVGAATGLALPLASRAGPVRASDIDAWRFRLTELATASGAPKAVLRVSRWPGAGGRTRQLLAAVDIIPAAYLVKKDGGQWPGTKLRGTLEANGFRLQSDGRFVYHEVESDAVIFHAVDGFDAPFTPERLRTENIAALRCVLEPVRLTQPWCVSTSSGRACVPCQSCSVPISRPVKGHRSTKPNSPPCVMR